MENITKESINEQIKAKTGELMAFAAECQEEVNKRQQAIQKSQQDLQALVKQFQQECDRKDGAIMQLQELVKNLEANPDAKPSEPEPEPRRKNGKK